MMPKLVYIMPGKGETWAITCERSLRSRPGCGIYQGFSKCNTHQHDQEGKHTDFWAHPQRPWLSESGLGHRNLHLQHTPQWCWPCWSGYHMLSSGGLYHVCWHFIGQNAVIWLYITVRGSGKYDLNICYKRREYGCGEWLESLFYML